MAQCVTLLFLATLAITVPSLRANIAEFDEYYQKRSEEARRAVHAAYEPDPFNVTADLNLHINLFVQFSLLSIMNPDSF